jgi:DNA replication ATP-dependent helicase Dna2
VARLETAGGAQVTVRLPERTRTLARALAALPDETMRGLRLRVFHLLRTPGDERGDRLDTTPASAIVLEPDLLFNITDINNAEYCVRHYPLRRMLPSPPSAASLRGTIIHAAFKELLKGGGEETSAYLRRALHNQLADLALRQIPYDEMAAEAEPHLRALVAWHTNGRNNLWSHALHVRAETFLLAPEIGLRGRLDFLLSDEIGGRLLELKTGAAHAALPKREHRWQVYGYQALLTALRPNDRDRPQATLLYSGTPGQAEGHGIPFTMRDLLRVLDLRNDLALAHATGVVPAPPGAKTCARCRLRAECLTVSSLLGWEPPESDEHPEAIQDADGRAFAAAYELLRLEGRAAEGASAALWRMSVAERCAAGIALGGLTLDGEPRQTESGEWEYRFRCRNTSELRENDAVLLSDGDPIYGEVVTGTILNLTDTGVTVWTPERISNPALLDRYSSDITHDRTVRNLWRWLHAEPRLRALVAGMCAPDFGDAPHLDDLPASFNEEQRAAVARALAAKDFMLIQGPPGTGKTQVVAEIARRAMERGERVLLAAFTNQAVDNALLRLVTSGIDDAVRLGHELSIAPELHRYRLKERASAVAGGQGELDPQGMRDVLLRARVVAATTATWSSEHYDAVGDPLRFDLAIIDEASQLTTPALLGALRFARRFVLVGDERQLPPLVQSEAAAEGGLRRSLFADLLARWGESASVALTQQYRMHPVICQFPGDEFYAGQLVADGLARTALLDVALPPTHPYSTLLAPEQPLVFVDVSAGAEPPGKVSRVQAEVVWRLVLALREGGVPAEEIGVIAPYRAQVAAIRQALAAQSERAVTVDTVDRFQGAERRVIVFSFGGRTTGMNIVHGSDFLAEPNRLNVALTRAQRKLLLVGDRVWLEGTPLLKRLIGYCASLYDGRGGVVRARVTAPARPDVAEEFGAAGTVSERTRISEA